MIEKLDIDKVLARPAPYDVLLFDKLNEVIDVVNGLQPKTENKESFIQARNRAIAAERERIIEEITSIPLCGLDLESLIKIVRGEENDDES